MLSRIRKDSSCVDCTFCDFLVKCPKDKRDCVGCGICVKGCPESARKIVPLENKMENKELSVNVVIDSENHSVLAGTTIRGFLMQLGKETYSTHVSHSCCSGGCFNCAVLVDDKLLRSCCTEVKEGMNIVTEREKINEHPPLRLVSFFPQHHADVSIFTHGCNFECGFCHNWNLTFSSRGRPLTPDRTVSVLSNYFEQSKESKGKDNDSLRVGISGGEPTINRRWLVDLVKKLKADYEKIRIQLDTNASLLTKDYIEELYEAGVTDISPDIKGLNLDTFMKLTGHKDKEIAQKLHQSIWKNVEYILSEYADKFYFTVGVPYHPDFVSHEELSEIGNKLASMNNNIDINLIIYQPAFRMRNTKEAPDEDVDKALSLLNETGLKVWCQEGEDISNAVDPMDLMFIMENE